MDAVQAIRDGEATPKDFDGELPTAASTMMGRRVRGSRFRSLLAPPQLGLPSTFQPTPTPAQTRIGTAILEAGRMSLDNNGASYNILYDDKDEVGGREGSAKQTNKQLSYA